MVDESDSDCSISIGDSNFNDSSNIASSLLHRRKRLLIPAEDRKGIQYYYIDDSTSETDCFDSDCDLNSNENESLNLIRYNNYVYNIWKRNNYRSWKPVSGNYVDPNILNIRRNVFSKLRDSGDSVNCTEDFSHFTRGSASSVGRRKKIPSKSKANRQNLSINKRSRSKSIIDSDQSVDKFSIDYSDTDKNMSSEENLLHRTVSSYLNRRKRKLSDNLENDARGKRTKLDNESDPTVKRKQILITDLVSNTNKRRNDDGDDTESSADVFVKQGSSRPNGKVGSVKNVPAVSKSKPNLKSFDNRFSSGSISEDEGISTECRTDVSPSDYSRLGTQEINFGEGVVKRSGRIGKRFLIDSISESSYGDHDEMFVTVIKNKKKDSIDNGPSLSEMPDSFPSRSVGSKSREKVQSSKNIRKSTSSILGDYNEDHDEPAPESVSKDRSKVLSLAQKFQAKKTDEMLEDSGSKRSSTKHCELSNIRHSSKNRNLKEGRNLSASSNYSSEDERTNEGLENFNKISARRSSLGSSANESAREDINLNGRANSESSETTDVERGKSSSNRNKGVPPAVSFVNDDGRSQRISRNSSLSLKDAEKLSNSSKLKKSIDTRRPSLSSSDGYEDNRREEISRNSFTSYSEDGEVIDNVRYGTPSASHRRSSVSSGSSENNITEERSRNSARLSSDVAGLKTPNTTGRRSSSKNDERESMSRDSRSFSTNSGSEDDRPKGKVRTSDGRESSASLDGSDYERRKDRRKNLSSNADISSTVVKEKSRKSSLRDDTLLQTPGFINSLKSKASSTPFLKHANEKNIESFSVQDQDGDYGDGASCSSDEENSVNNKVDHYKHHVLPEVIKNIGSKLVEGIRSEQFEEDLLFVEDISDSDEIWVAQCPKSLKVESLLGKKFDLTGGITTLSGSTKDGSGDVDYEAFTSSLSNNDEPDQNTSSGATVNNVYCLLPSRKHQKLKLKAIETKGTIKIEERIALPTPNTIKFTSSTEISLPECLRIRHPLLGSDFSEQLRAFEYLNRNLNTPGKKSFDKSLERKKKRSHSISDNQGYKIQKPLDNATDDDSPEKKKKKKHKQKHKSFLDEDVDQDGACVMEEAAEEYKTIKTKRKKKKHKHSHCDD